MPRYYWEHVELIDDTWVYAVYDRQFGSNEDIARCDRGDDAQKIVDALNAIPPRSRGVFG